MNFTDQSRKLTGWHGIIADIGRDDLGGQFDEIGVSVMTSIFFFLCFRALTLLQEACAGCFANALAGGTSTHQHETSSA